VVSVPSQSSIDDDIIDILSGMGNDGDRKEAADDNNDEDEVIEEIRDYNNNKVLYDINNVGLITYRINDLKLDNFLLKYPERQSSPSPPLPPSSTAAPAIAAEEEDEEEEQQQQEEEKQPIIEVNDDDETQSQEILPEPEKGTESDILDGQDILDELDSVI
jgi:hypothetical protein